MKTTLTPPRQNAPRRADIPASAPTPASFDWAAVKAHAPFSHPKIGDVWIDKLTPTHVSYTAFAGETPTGTRLAKVKWSRAEFEAGQEAAGPSKTRKRTVLTFHGVKAPPAQPSAQGGPLPRVRGKIPATQRLCELRDKLQALADRGINGEKEAAAAKLARLLARVDFSKPVLRTADLFAGVFVKANVASPVLPVPPEDYDVGNAVKYAIEKEAHIPCCWRADSLMAEAAPETANRLHSIAATVATSFRELWRQFAANPGVNPADRANFVAGLADGMLDEVRTGTALPARAAPAPPRRKVRLEDGDFPPAFPQELQHFAHFNRAVEKRTEEENGRITWIRYYYEGKLIAQSAPDLNQMKLHEAFHRIRDKRARELTKKPGISLHPYSVATNLGRQIRFSVPLETIRGELDRAVKGQLT